MQPDAISSKLDAKTRVFYRHVIEMLTRAGAQFMVGGAYAFARYTGIERHTKDLDIFVRPEDYETILKLLADAGYATSLVAPHWLAKAYSGDDYIDVIFSSGNGIARVDDLWFHHAPTDEVLGMRVKIVPVEEMIWSKAFVMERERYDGADLMHLIHARGNDMDWDRLMARFRPHWRLLLSYLVLFGFVYPPDRERVPEGVMRELLTRQEIELRHPSHQHVCQGTLVSSRQYLYDLQHDGYADARDLPGGPLTSEQVQQSTAALRE